MVNVSDAFKTAVVADTRRTVAKAVVEIIDPDVVYGSVTDSGNAITSKPDQIKDKVMGLDTPYATLEPNRWILNGTLPLPEAGAILGNQGWVSAALSNGEGAFAQDPWVELTFSGVSILQALTVIFGSRPLDGIPSDYTVAVMVGETVGWSQRVQGNTAISRYFGGFTVSNPTGIRVTVHHTSIPGRRVHVAELIAGIYEEWTSDQLVSMAIKQQGDPSCMALPYGTMTMAMDNSDHRFDPGDKGSLFQSLENRIGVPVFLGVRLPDGSDEYAPVGTYYQYQNGWRTGSYGITMTWTMVDIIGLLTARVFVPPATLPTTLEGWVAAIVAQLGTNFAGRYIVDEAIASTPMTVSSAEEISSMRCGDLLRCAAMAAGGWPRADNATGKVLVSKLGTDGGTLDLDNNGYPSIQANNDVAVIKFTIYPASGESYAYAVAGNVPSSSTSLSVDNPFLHTTAAADAVAAQILAWYGGNKLSVTGRGNPAAEIGDLDTVELSPGSNSQGRRLYQTLNYTGGILAECQTQLKEVAAS